MLVGYLDLTASQAIKVFSLLVGKINHELSLENGITSKFQNCKNIAWRLVPEINQLFNYVSNCKLRFVQSTTNVC